MTTYQIRRQRTTSQDAKEALYEHILNLPMAKQREFVTTALQLIAERTHSQEIAVRGSCYESDYDSDLRVR